MENENKMSGTAIMVAVAGLVVLCVACMCKCVKVGYTWLTR